MRATLSPAVLVALGGGLVLATQARVNGQFGQSVGNPAAAAMLSAATGLALLTPVALMATSIRSGLAALPSAIRRGSLPGWMLFAGVGGALLLFSQAYAVPALGVAVYSVLLVASVTGTGLIIDKVGLGSARSQALTTNRVGGAGLAVVAALVAAGPGLSSGRLALVAVIVAIAAGAGGATQSAILGRLGAVTGQPLAAVWVNFVGATATLAGIVAIVTARGAAWAVPPVGWLWLGGPLGLVIVVIIVATVPRAGVLLVAMAMTAGQLLGSLLWDVVAPVSDRGIDAWSVAGTAVLLGAIILAGLPGRR